MKNNGRSSSWRKKNSNYAFIDNENVNISIQRMGRKIDRTRLRIFLEKELQIEKAYMFLWYMEEFEPMYELFRDSWYELVFKKVHQGENVQNKWNIDAELVLHTMIHINNYHQAVIVSWDGDFASLAEYLTSTNKLRAVVVPNKKRSSGFLQEAADGRFLYLDGFKHRLAYDPRNQIKVDFWNREWSTPSSKSPSTSPSFSSSEWSKKTHSSWDESEPFWL